MLTLVLTLSSLLEVYTDFFSFLFSLSAAVASRQLMRWQMSTGRVETTCCMGEKKACSNKGRKIHNNKKPVKERENEGTSLDTVTEAFKVFFFQNKGCCVQPPLPLLIPAAPSVVPAQVLCDCELNQIKALIQGKKKKNNSTTKNKQEKKDRKKENCKAAATAVKRDVRQVTASPGLSEPGVAEQTGGPWCLETCSQDRQWRHTGLSYHRLQQNLISKSKIQVVRLTTMKHEHKVLYHKLRWIEHGWNLSHCCNI